MKILYHHRIASKDGQYVHVEELTNAFQEAGHELIFVCPKFSNEAQFGSEGGVAAKLKTLLPRGMYELIEFTYSFVIAFKLMRSILKNRPDFIYERYNLYQPAGVIIARLFSIPLLLEINAPLVQERAKYSGLAMQKFAKVIEDFTWRNATYALPVTYVLAGHLIEAKVNQEKIVVIPNGVNRNILGWLDEKIKNRKESNNKKIVIGFTGFINPWHKLDRALEAIAKIGNKDIKFICVGKGKIRPELEEKARLLGISDQVTFTGLVSRKEIFNTISQFDIALQPSVTEYASPLKLFEYLACGALVVAPDMPNIREILSSNDALLFDPKSDEDFRGKLIDALERFGEYAQVRKAARDLIDLKQFTWQNNAERVIGLIENMGKSS